MHRHVLRSPARWVVATVAAAAVVLSAAYVFAITPARAATTAAERFPVSTVNADLREVAEVYRQAQDVEIVDCMAAQGFTFMPFTAEHRKAYLASRPARSNGFAAALPEPGSSTIVDGGAGEPHAPGWSQYWSALSEAEQRQWLTAFEGRGDAEATAYTLSDGMEIAVPTGGCLGAARRALLGDDFTEFERVDFELQLLAVEALQAARSDAAYTTALGRWRSCMTASGHKAASPEALNEQAAEALLDARAVGLAPTGLDRIEADAAVAAVADAACRKSSDLEAVQQQTQQLAERAVADRAEALLGTWNDLRAATLDAAASRVELPSTVTVP